LEKILAYGPHILFGIGLWYLVNGILHDIFVLLSDHGKQYDRNLLRLLFDGHILIVGGAVLMIRFSDLKANYTFAWYITLRICLSMVVYCGMIWPFLKSVMTMLINIFGSALVILKLFQLNQNS